MVVLLRVTRLRCPLPSLPRVEAGENCDSWKRTKLFAVPSWVCVCPPLFALRRTGKILRGTELGVGSIALSRTGNKFLKMFLVPSWVYVYPRSSPFLWNVAYSSLPTGPRHKSHHEAYPRLWYCVAFSAKCTVNLMQPAAN